MNRKVIRAVILIICVIVIAYEAVMIAKDRLEYKEASDEYKRLESIAVTYPEDEDISEIIDYPLLSIDFKRLKEINPDFVAWIYFPCLEISYPVVKEKEVDEYLYKTFDLSSNKAGSIFEDVLSDPEFCGLHDIVFGHNMKDKSMFGKLKALYQADGEELLKKNPYVYIYTSDKVYQYRVFAYYITDVGSRAYSVVTDDEEYEDFVDYIRAHTAYTIPTEIDLEKGGNILTLSTCSGASGSNKRFVVHTFKTASYDR